MFAYSHRDTSTLHELRTAQPADCSAVE